MEAAGVYWKPVYYVLEDGFSVLLGQSGSRQTVPRICQELRV
jgi:hypothetical protein